MAELLHAYLQMLFSEGPGIVAVNLGGEKKDLVSSKVGDCSLEPGAGAAKPPRILPCAAVSHLGVPPGADLAIWHLMGREESTLGVSHRWLMLLYFRRCAKMCHDDCISFLGLL